MPRELFDGMDYPRAVQAYLSAYPAVSFESIRSATNRDLGADLNDMIIADNFADATGVAPLRCGGFMDNVSCPRPGQPPQQSRALDLIEV